MLKRCVNGVLKMNPDSNTDKLKKIFPNETSRKYEEYINLFLGFWLIFQSIFILIAQPEEMIFCWLYLFAVLGNLYYVITFIIRCLNYENIYTLCENCNVIYVRKNSHCSECGKDNDNILEEDLFWFIIWLAFTLFLWYQWEWFINNLIT